MFTTVDPSVLCSFLTLYDCILKRSKIFQNILCVFGKFQGRSKNHFIFREVYGEVFFPFFYESTGGPSTAKDVT